MTDFTPIASSVGGVLIGLASALLLLGSGRIAGISGIFGGALEQAGPERIWRAVFVAGLVVGGGAMALVAPQLFSTAGSRTLLLTAVAGVVVGFGTRLGSGCTSGHGVCGISRFSVRSMLATVTFLATGIVPVFLLNLLLGAQA